jgi:hypothetical protein
LRFFAVSLPAYESEGRLANAPASLLRAETISFLEDLPTPLTNSNAERPKELTAQCLGDNDFSTPLMFPMVCIGDPAQEKFNGQMKWGSGFGLSN